MTESACCRLPPVEAKYTPKGDYSTSLSGLKTYSVGPNDAEGAVIFVYDIFGYAPQTVQACDLVASQGFRVYMPDILQGQYAQGSWFAPDASEEVKQIKTKYFTSFPGQTSSQSEQISKLIKDVRAQGHAKVGAVGLCWGWKAIVQAKDVDELDALASNHPSFAAKDDCDKVSAPVCLQPSGDEDIEVMQAIFDSVEKRNPGKNVLKNFPTMPHGWAAARANLEDEDGRKQFHDAYVTLVDFFKKTLA